MRAVGVFRKALREARRDRMVVALTLVFAPLMVMIYYFTFNDWTPNYNIAILNNDQGVTSPDGRIDAGADLAKAIRAAPASDQVKIHISTVGSKDDGLRRLRERDVSAMVILPADFSRSLLAMRTGQGTPGQATFTLCGDVTNSSYAVAAVLASEAIEGYVQQLTGRSGPLRVTEEALDASGTRSDFELWVPGLFVFAAILVLFQAAMVVTREYESGAVRRLRLTRMTSVDYLAGTSGMILLISLVAVLLTFATAVALGFHSQGPLWLAVLAMAITTMSIIAIGMIVAAFSRTVAQAFVIANFPLAILMFFSGAMFPMARTTFFTIAGHPVGPFELLPPTHTVTALNKIFTNGAGVGDVAFELICLFLLTAGYFAIGAALLNRRRLRAA